MPWLRSGPSCRCTASQQFSTHGAGSLHMRLSSIFKISTLIQSLSRWEQTPLDALSAILHTYATGVSPSISPSHRCTLSYTQDDRVHGSRTGNKVQHGLTTGHFLLQILHSMYYSSIVCLPFLVSSIYWASMWVGPWFDHDFDAWSAVSIHAMNSVFAVFEIVVTQTFPLPWLHLLALLAIMAFYLALAYLTKLTAGVYIYLWLDPQVGAWKIIGHVVGYSMANVVIFNLVRAAIWLRCRLTRKTNTPSVNMLQRVDSNSSSHATLWTKQDFEMQKADSVKLPSRRVSLAPTIPKQSFDVSSIDPSAFPLPEPVYRPYPRRSSSYHVQNFSRPQSVATMMSSSTKHSGFWV